ncbi:MAG: TauD/TfdA family dioxygenase [Candidatus Thiodiazotropha endolucinida]|uniref:TauD/TfdA family dioxygenase n=1 Tax=Candidatus Thiodiazotropha taylori TaxID=2792791 RepID=A0A9E4NJ68_9GAMM|nr:TauD/TfdA family dioxygenase [Candidatus Thiodiazotropha taylori]MBT3040607.1 TauD/TfdA family dioxygenase [Candidatus Thiodiazotropha sp. (ex Codakia orbicularis)]MCG7862533.1 TauD/TfdA family dioxygenase [Candidatus Thiodiazotropha endolucinida]MBT3054186.1 TauD/TfdA family dioxygenase [Candidatus Thiodiazotropha sp. (ex Codakia orbicularis)]MBV2124237.1 TauD/TfdA family dioxygenase [Candidatus Thiodiazotropha taylori]
MEIKQQKNCKMGVIVDGMDVKNANKAEIDELKSIIYKHKIVIFKGLNLSSSEYADLAKKIGEPEAYYEPMYHHPKEKEIFVSSNVSKDGKQIGVPKTGKFWHVDYAFKERPFAFTLLNQKEVPCSNRGTFFVDMAEAYRTLPSDVQQIIENATCQHSVRRYFKIRPTDVYRPLSEVINEVDNKAPPVLHPAVIAHPVTKEKILYVSEGFTISIQDENGHDLGDALLQDLFEYSGQRDPSFSHELIHLQTSQKGDLLIFDNRSLVHCAKHSTTPAAAVSHRITLHDNYDAYHVAA